jgi:nicotinamidase-related amidase
MTSLDPTRTAIVAVHLQNDIVGADGAFAPFFRAEIDRVGTLTTAKRALDAGRAAGAHVVYTRVAWQPDYSDLHANSPLLNIVVQQNCLVDGTPGAAVVDELAPKESDRVVTHQRVGGFHDSDLDDVLRGVATNASVEGTARAASDLGYRVLVVSDACSAATPEAHAASVESLGLLAEITTTDDLVAALAPHTANAV